MIVIARMAAKELGEAVEVKQGGGLKHRLGDPIDLTVATVAFECQCKGAVLDRPDRSAVVTAGLGAGMCRRERPHAPSRKEIGREEARCGTRHKFCIDDAGGEAVAGMRGVGVDLAL